MATERNPFEQKPIDAPNVIPMQQGDANISFELDPEGGVVVNFGEEEIQEEVTAEEWYSNLVETIDTNDLSNISRMVIDNLQ